MLDLLRPTALRRALRPQRGALANAAEALALQAVAKAERREGALLQAQSLGTCDWAPLRRGPSTPSHGVQFAQGPAELVDRLAAFVVEGLLDGDVCLVIGTPSTRAGLRHRLALCGLAGSDRVVEVDAATQLERLLREGRPDPALFTREIGTAVRARLQTGRGFRGFGEMVGLLYERGDLAGALELEQLWDGLQRELGFPLLCAYPSAAADEPGFRGQVCREHSHLVG